jgi:hypothetical protein
MPGAGEVPLRQQPQGGHTQRLARAAEPRGRPSSRAAPGAKYRGALPRFVLP